MSERLVADDGPSQLTAGPRGIEEMSMELEAIQEHLLSLLERLDRPPRTVRVQAGEVVLDISWPEPMSIMTGRVQTAETVIYQENVPDSATDSNQTAVISPAPPEDYLTSPSVGVFYHSSGPGAEPFVSVGTQVKAGQQIGIIEAMKLMIPIEADRDGTITFVLKDDGQPVEYAERLFALGANPTEG